ncbi:MAG: AAA family ATPase, partial [Chloroflexota bacterium]
MAHEDAAPEDRAATEAAPVGLGRITRVRLKNYKSIVSCDVELQPLTILVGPNGSGKSNFLDALSFVKQALVLGLDQALRMRGNVERILSAARPPGEDSFTIELGFDLGEAGPGRYRFVIERAPGGGFMVSRERFDLICAQDTLGQDLYWIRENGATKWSSDGPLEVHSFGDTGRLFLMTYGGNPNARAAYDLLTRMVFYSPLPGAMRDLKRRDVVPHLRSGGANAASMLQQMQHADPDLVWRITQYMSRVLPGLEKIQVDDLAGRDLLRVSLASEGEAAPRWFDADQLSDGTLRALAILVALFQHRLGGKS